MGEGPTRRRGIAMAGLVLLGPLLVLAPTVGAKGVLWDEFPWPGRFSVPAVADEVAPLADAPARAVPNVGRGVCLADASPQGCAPPAVDDLQPPPAPSLARVPELGADAGAAMAGLAERADPVPLLPPAVAGADAGDNPLPPPGEVWRWVGPVTLLPVTSMAASPEPEPPLVPASPGPGGASASSWPPSLHPTPRGTADGAAPDPRGAAAGPHPLVGTATSRPGLGASGPPSATPGAMLALACAGLLLPAWALYRRVQRGHLLDLPTRQALVAAIRAAPGATAGELSTRLGLHYTTVEHHLRALHAAGLVAARRLGGQMRYFEPRPSHGVLETAALTAARTHAAAALLRLVLKAPGLAPAAAARRLGLGRSGVKYHVDRLVAWGLLEARHSGGRVALHLAPGAAEAVAFALAAHPAPAPAPPTPSAVQHISAPA